MLLHYLFLFSYIVNNIYFCYIINKYNNIF